MRTLFRRLLAEDDGQELVEYALLAAFVALASVVALDALKAALRTAYTNWNAAAQSCWEMPAPGAGGGC
jgi:Flp pilus assembly pilin Flp